MRSGPNDACERTIQSASVGLDRGLSRFERHRMEQHRSSCPDCDMMIAKMTDFTSGIRAADPLTTGTVTVGATATRRSHVRRWRPRGLRVAGVAAAMAASAALGFLAASHPLTSQPTAAKDQGVAERVSLVLALGKSRGRHLRCDRAPVYACGLTVVPLGTPLVGDKYGVSPPNATMTTVWR
ncbi:MAG: hypothetical protein QOD66_348 [Solirubrobacteraceae bacterium]|nr:hypothetical protein [Solirubrobacteraceae bacterium]